MGLSTPRSDFTQAHKSINRIIIDSGRPRSTAGFCFSPFLLRVQRNRNYQRKNEEPKLNSNTSFARLDLRSRVHEVAPEGPFSGRSVDFLFPESSEFSHCVGQFTTNDASQYSTAEKGAIP